MSKQVVTFSIDKEKNFAEWYEEILVLADILDKRYPVKGMPVMLPYGFYMHNRAMEILEKEWESQGIEKCLFPIAVPYDFLAREREHVAGFFDECFWITKAGKNDLEKPFALRPTSETAMYSMFSLWVRSFRDLPLKVHQTVNVYRYETKNTKPLIRVREIPWNEAHTCHATAEDALENLRQAWVGYYRLIHDALLYTGTKLRRAPWDKFAGAEFTEVLDVVMPCGRVLQAVGAHYLGQKFARGFDIKFLDKDNEQQYCEMTCYGVSTRLLAAALSVHGDNGGLVLPPALARYQVVIVPIAFAKKPEVLEKAREVEAVLRAAGIRVHLDDREIGPGAKYFHWEMKGVPLRLELGPRDIAKGHAMLVTRAPRTKQTAPLEGLVDSVRAKLDEFAASLKERAFAFHRAHVTECASEEDIERAILEVGGFARIPFFTDGTDEALLEEAKSYDELIHEKTGAEIRGFCPDDEPPAEGTLCFLSGKPAVAFAYVARAY